MTNFIDPRCSTPIFRMDDISLAKSCGKLSGYYICIFVSIFFTVIYGIYRFILNNQYNFHGDIDKYNQNIKTANIVFICALIILWIIGPILSGYLNEKSWEGYKYQIEQLVKDGISKQEAIDKIESTYNSKQLASSMRSSRR